MTARLLVSLSGVDPRTLSSCADLAEALDTRGVPLTLLVAPRLTTPDTLAWIRTRTSDAVLMHGSDHAANPGVVRRGRRPEFAALPAHEAGLRLTAAMAAMERAGLTADGFAGPRWLASPGTRTALRARGFRLCADALAVHDLRTGEAHRAKVQSLGHRETPGRRESTETLRCFALVLAAARTTRRQATLRLAVSATDLTRPGPRQAVLDAVDVALGNNATPATYAALVAPQPIRR
ncbi:DUF2334 domain-containing protein [Actinokineospora sp. PR83]|uniref:DUF2334 domain-containing protein n=1 Tax=Actinokineospora sp. PR83 TaxID=2884908 RepID=UPI0027E18281|nr:DUF2334 domain-containing protein [Actinokineospora sp. PR83]MCG8919675.1 DUF2334 domain-containing protein [Actinokineospora sp. PR83]